MPVVSLLLRQPPLDGHLSVLLRPPFSFGSHGGSFYYAWPPNRPRKSWSLRRTINVQILRQVTKLPARLGVVDGRDPSLEVPQKELESLNARFVWVPELGEEDIMGIVAEHAERAGVESIVIPAYWIMKGGLELSPAH